jgi:hypothetical protein
MEALAFIAIVAVMLVVRSGRRGSVVDQWLSVDPANCNKRVGTRYIDPDCMRKRGGPHVMEVAGLGRVDVLGAPVRRRDDGEPE